jgi:hypothetical protein
MEKMFVSDRKLSGRDGAARVARITVVWSGILLREITEKRSMEVL